MGGSEEQECRGGSSCAAPTFSGRLVGTGFNREEEVLVCSHPRVGGGLQEALGSCHHPSLLAVPVIPVL